VRSRTMSRIRGADTKIETVFRRELWRNGIRYRKNYKELPGKPDIAITKYKIAVFCDGEFWHGKEWNVVKEKLNTRREFWIQKIERTIKRDTETERRLAGLGWTVLRFWGRDIEKNLELCVADVKAAVLQSRVESAAVEYGYGPDDFGDRDEGEASFAAEPAPSYGDAPESPD